MIGGRLARHTNLAMITPVGLECICEVSQLLRVRSRSVTSCKGDIKGHLFARGDKEGIVRVWDVRNLDGYQSASLKIPVIAGCI